MNVLYYVCFEFGKISQERSSSIYKNYGPVGLKTGGSNYNKRGTMSFHDGVLILASCSVIRNEGDTTNQMMW